MQGNVRESQRGSHTVQSHGIKLAKTHIHDWVILLILLGLMIGLGVMPPFYRYVGKDMMSDLKYPHKSSTVPFWAVPVGFSILHLSFHTGYVVAVLLPIVIFVAFYFQRRDVYDLHHAVLGILFSVLITGVLTNAIKDAVGRPRPDFFWRGFPDGKELYHQVTGKVICYGEKSLMNAGHKSFPSGHTSWSFAGLTFCALYLSGKIKVFDCRGRVAKLCIVFLPLLIASLVGISRVDDYYRHHWQDVFAGGVLGTVVATFCYLQFFPPHHHMNGWGPHAYFHMLESIGGADLPSAGDQQAEEGNSAGSPGVRHNGTNSGDRNNARSSRVRHNGRNLDDLESARMQYR